jgi:hypothetical protein
VRHEQTTEDSFGAGRRIADTQQGRDNQQRTLPTPSSPPPRFGVFVLMVNG